jgi:hypothetical protein
MMSLDEGKGECLDGFLSLPSLLSIMDCLSILRLGVWVELKCMRSPMGVYEWLILTI